MCEEEWKGYCLKSKKDEGEEVVKHKIGVQGSLNENDDSRRCLCPAMLVIARSRLSLSRSRSRSLGVFFSCRQIALDPWNFFLFHSRPAPLWRKFRGSSHPSDPSRGKRNNYLSRADVEKCQPPPAISYSYPVLSPPVSPTEKLWARPRFRPL